MQSDCIMRSAEPLELYLWMDVEHCEAEREGAKKATPRRSIKYTIMGWDLIKLRKILIIIHTSNGERPKERSPYPNKINIYKLLLEPKRIRNFKVQLQGSKKIKDNVPLIPPGPVWMWTRPFDWWPKDTTIFPTTQQLGHIFVYSISARSGSVSIYISLSFSSLLYSVLSSGVNWRIRSNSWHSLEYRSCHLCDSVLMQVVARGSVSTKRLKAWVTIDVGIWLI